MDVIWMSRVILHHTSPREMKKQRWFIVHVEEGGLTSRSSLLSSKPTRLLALNWGDDSTAIDVSTLRTIHLVPRWVLRSQAASELIYVVPRHPRDCKP